MTPAVHDFTTLPEQVRARRDLFVFHLDPFTRNEQYMDDVVRAIKEGRINEMFPGIDSTDFDQRRHAEQQYRRYQAMEESYRLKVSGTRVQVKQEISEELSSYHERVQRESIIADYLRRVHVDFPFYGFAKKAALMDTCHRNGCVGKKPDSKKVIAWDHKCEDVSLCPHTAWKETQRLNETYTAGVLDLLERDRHRRVFYTVLNPPNYPESHLSQGKEEVMTLCRKWARHKAVACPLHLNEHTGRWEKTKPFSLNDCIDGYLVVQEDPLGSGYDWNIHNNLLMVTRGPFDYHLARAWWNEIVHEHTGREGAAFCGFNPIQPYPDDVTAMGEWPAMEKAVRKSMFEIVKYTIATVAEKSDLKADTTTAPALSNWPPSLFVEWHLANKKFRRTRSYGCLYAFDRQRWDVETPQGRYDKFLQPARVRGYEDLELNYVYGKFTAMPEDHRAQVRRVMRKPDPFTLEDVIWLGQVLYLDHDNGYFVFLSAPGETKSVALLPGDNFSEKTGRTNNFGTGPPVQ